MQKQAEKLYLVDGSGFIFRAFHALPPLKRPDGTPVGAVFGFCNMLIRLLERQAQRPAQMQTKPTCGLAHRTFPQLT